MSRVPNDELVLLCLRVCVCGCVLIEVCAYYRVLVLACVCVNRIYLCVRASWCVHVSGGARLSWIYLTIRQSL